MKTTIAKGLSRITLFTACVITLGACTYGPDGGKGGDYRQNHPVRVGSDPVALNVQIPTSGVQLSYGDSVKFKNFLRLFLSRGATRVTVETTQPEQARAVLLHHGLRDGEFVVTQSPTLKAPNALLSFTAAKAISPECGDWSAPSGYTGSNKIHSNFGCSLQRNTSEMIDNPNRLIKPAAPDSGNASRTDANIFTHRAGEAKERLFDGDE